jgi:hypothetical protein
MDILHAIRTNNAASYVKMMSTLYDLVKYMLAVSHLLMLTTNTGIINVRELPGLRQCWDVLMFALSEWTDVDHDLFITCAPSTFVMLSFGMQYDYDSHNLNKFKKCEIVPNNCGYFVINLIDPQNIMNKCV